jgi:uncharacterized protein YecT (DUF1311 family)
MNAKQRAKIAKLNQELEVAYAWLEAFKAARKEIDVCLHEAVARADAKINRIYARLNEQDAKDQ